jgi:hypothetical protein
MLATTSAARTIDSGSAGHLLAITARLSEVPPSYSLEGAFVGADRSLDGNLLGLRE